MYKLLVMALKEVRVTFRDRGAILLTLVVPFVLSLAVAAAFGGGNATLSHVPVLVLNQDSGQLGQSLAAMFQPDVIGDLVSASAVSEAETARGQVQSDQAAALVTIPAGLTQALSPVGAGEPVSSSARVDIYANPAQPIGVSVVQAIVTRFLEQANVRSQGVQLLINELATRNLLSQAESAEFEARLRQEMASNQAEPALSLNVVSATGRNFNWLDYFAPSMAILFLMFTVTGGARLLLAERQEGTLPRLFVTPTRPALILVGKMAGIALSGLLQILVLWAATSLIGAYWGDARWVALGCLVLVMCATGLGAIIAAWARNQNQAAVMGPTIVLGAAALSGNFLPRLDMPDWVQMISLITPNGWGLDLFIRLQSGGDLQAILPILGGMLALTVIYYIIATIGFQRQFA